MSGESEEEEEDDELQNSVELRERMDCTARKRSLRRLRKPEQGTRELYQRALRQNKCESTGLRTILSGVGALNV